MASFEWPNSGSGGGGGPGEGTLATANLYDPVDTVLPAVAPLVIDGVTVTTGMIVLFSNLASGNNELYQATVVGAVVSWVAVDAFDGGPNPPVGTLISITQGTSFGGQVGYFNGTTWLFNYTVRYFNGLNYYEQSSLNTSALADATSNGTVFSVAYVGSENILVNYSIVRGSAKEIGTLPITTNGTLVGISGTGSDIPSVGVLFNAVISGPDLVLRYTTTSTGTSGTMQYYLVRWSDSAGGPAGPPSYSGGSSSTPAAGSTGNVQFNGAGLLAANSNFNYDDVNNFLELGSAQFSILYSGAFLDNQAAPVAFLTLPATYNSLFMSFTVIRGSNIRSETMVIATDGVVALNTEILYSESGTTGVTLSAALSGGNIVISYTSTSTGSGGTLKWLYYGW